MRISDWSSDVCSSDLGDNQYDMRDRPTIRQIERERLAQFGVLTMVSALLNHTLNPEGVRLLADLETTADGAELVPPLLHDLPQLRKDRQSTRLNSSH